MKKKTRHRHIADTPFMSMSKEGAQRAMDKTAKSLLVEMLDTARQGKTQIYLAMLTLSRPDKPDVIVNVFPEYGDDVGLAMMRNDCRICEELGLLTAGEKLTVGLFVVREIEPVEEPEDL